MKEVSTAVQKKNTKLSLNLRTYAIIGAIVVLAILFGFLTDGSFITVRNISNLFRQMSIYGILGAGALLVIVAGGIDLSVGALLGFVGCLGAVLMTFEHWDTGPVIVVMLLCGAICGTLQGFVTSYLKVPSFIVTLSGQMIFRGAALAFTNGVTITPINPSFLVFGQEYLNGIIGWVLAGIGIIAVFYQMIKARKNKRRYGFTTASLFGDIAKSAVYSVLMAAFVYVMNAYMGIPVPVLIVLLLVLVLTFVAEKTIFGRRLYAIGGNVDAVRYSGINVKKNYMLVFTLNGVIAAITGIVLTARQASGLASSGTSMELDAIAAAVIGGASMSGGVGRVFGAIIGALLMATIDNGMTMLNMETFWQYIVKGLILTLAVLFDIKVKGKK